MITAEHQHPDVGPCRFISVNEKNIHLIEAGSGAPVILIHGGQAWAYAWRHQVAPLVAAGFRVIAPDLPGCGYSDLPSRFDYSIEGLSVFLERLLDTLGIKQAVFAASSAGGLPVLDFAIRHSERVAALILASTCGVPHKEPLLWRLIRWPVVGELMKLFLTHDLVRSNLQQMVFDGRQITDDVTAAYYQPLRRFGAWAAQLRLERNWRPVWVEQHIDTISARTLVVWGENDPVHLGGMAYEFGRRVKNARAVFLPACGHLPHEEKPDEFNILMKDFLMVRAG